MNAAKKSASRQHARAQRQGNYRKGQWSEWIAAFLLILKGYRICALRYRAPCGEIDLIARRRKRIAFVEVKARRTREEGLWAVTPHQQVRIARTADYWLARHSSLREYDIGFDVILLTPWRFPHHIKEAFRVD